MLSALDEYLKVTQCTENGRWSAGVLRYEPRGLKQWTVMCECKCKELVDHVARRGTERVLLALFEALCDGNHCLCHCESVLSSFAGRCVCCVTVIFLKMQFHLLATIDRESCGKEPERRADSWSPRQLELKINGCWTSMEVHSEKWKCLLL